MTDRVLEVARLRFGRSLIEIAITIFPYMSITGYGIKITRQTSVSSIRSFCQSSDQLLDYGVRSSTPHSFLSSSPRIV